MNNADGPRRGRVARLAAAGAAVGLLLGLLADITGLITFTTGASLPQLIGRGSMSPTPPSASSSPEPFPSATVTPTPSPSTAPTPAPSPRPSSVDAEVKAFQPPSSAAIRHCIDVAMRRYGGWQGEVAAAGITAAELGEPVVMQVHIASRDLPYTLWQYDADCQLRPRARLTPGQSATFTVWGGALWDLARGTAPAAVAGPGPISRQRSQSVFTFEVGSTTVRYAYL